MNNLIKIIKYGVTFVILIIIYNILLYIVSLIPSSAIYENCVKSAEQMRKEGYAFLVAFPYTIDNATDALMINEAYSIDSEEPIESYLKVRKNYVKDIVQYELRDTTHDLLTYSQNRINADGTPRSDNGYWIQDELENTLNHSLITSVNYARYYHGYLVFIRPLLLFFDAYGIRVLNLIIFILLFLLLAYVSYKKLGKYNMFAICFSLLAFDFFATSYSLQQYLTLLLAIISSIVLLIKIERFNWEKLTFMLFIVGSIECFLDFLTMPALTLALPLLIYLLYYSKNHTESNKKLFIKVLKACIMWSIGYVFTWLSKWIICDLLTDAEVFKSALEQIKYRSVGAPKTQIDYVLVIIKHLSTCSVIALIIILILDKLFEKGKINISQSRYSIDNKPVVVFVCLIPIFWCILTFNHFISHGMISYKNFMLVLAFLLLLFFEKECNPKKQ